MCVTTRINVKKIFHHIFRFVFYNKITLYISFSIYIYMYIYLNTFVNISQVFVIIIYLLRLLYRNANYITNYITSVFFFSCMCVYWFWVLSFKKTFQKQNKINKIEKVICISINNCIYVCIFFFIFILYL